MDPLFVFPASRVEDPVVEDTYFGHTVSDPYRWLENPDSIETQEWIGEQNKLTQEFLVSNADMRNDIRSKLEQMYNYEKQGCPFRRGKFTFFFYNSGLQNQSVLYVLESASEAELNVHNAEVLLDMNSYRQDGTASLACYDISEDGNWLAYGVSESGSDWITIKIRSVVEKTDLEDTVKWVKFSGLSWMHDNSGFFYSRYPEPSSARMEGLKEDAAGTEMDAYENHHVCFHKTGTPQESDVLVYATPDHPKWLVGASLTEDGRFLILSAREGTDRKNILSYVDLNECPDVNSLSIHPVISEFVGEYDPIANDEFMFVFKTNCGASRSKLIRMDIRYPLEVEDFIPEQQSVLETALVFGKDYLVLEYLENVMSRISVFSLQSGEKVQDISFPIGSVLSIVGRRVDDDFFFKFSSFVDPGCIYRVVSDSFETTVFHRTTINGMCDPSEFVSEQVWYESKDGTKVPMFLNYRKDIEKSGALPVLLYGYGGFNISITPSFAVSNILFIQNFRGIFAVANIRGGGEFGEDWHEGGKKMLKQNCFDDFITAAQFLVNEGYTNPSKITIRGGSNGGLLVGAVLNQSPQSFGCAVAQVGVMDMLRFHKFTIGHAWTLEYGCSESSEEEFLNLYRISPYHNVSKHLVYPPVLVTTADHDDRVSPAHSFKYIAALQSCFGSCDKPFLIRIDTKSGHGAGKPTTKILDEYADMYAFIAKSTNTDYYP